MRLRYSIIVALASALVLGGAGMSHATTFSYVASLDGLQETPPNAAPGSGTATLTYDDVANTLTTTITFSGLLAGLTASHIHGPAPVGVAASVLHGFVTAPSGAFAGTYSDVWSGLTPAQQSALSGALLYINIHSGAFPGGEIRGQIVKDTTTPSHAVSWGKIKGLYR